MADEKLVLVKRFEELKTGMRVVVDCRICDQQPISILTDLVPAGTPPRGFSVSADCDMWMSEPKHYCKGNNLPCAISDETVRRRLVRRFASDLGIDYQIASEANPYLSRSVVGTGGVDEVRIPAKERR